MTTNDTLQPAAIAETASLVASIKSLHAAGSQMDDAIYSIQRTTQIVDQVRRDATVKRCEELKAEAFQIAERVGAWLHPWERP
jgi:hypothetical protein